MKRLKYNEIFDKVDLYEGLEKDTLTGKYQRGLPVRYAQI